jgi:predicted nucleic acid-binding protein
MWSTKNGYQGNFPKMRVIGSLPTFFRADLLSVPIRLFPHLPILLRAFDLAREYQLTVYDTLYLALAEDHGAVIFTADRKLLKAATDLRLR